MCSSASNVYSDNSNKVEEAVSRLTDQEFFSALNLEQKQLLKVKTAVGNNDFTGAKTAFVAHIKDREKPVWFFNWRDKPEPHQRPKDYNTSKADRMALNEMYSRGIWHSLGDDIDWTKTPTPDYDGWTSSINNHTYWKYLGRAYWNTGNEKYTRAFINQMTDWVDDNPVPLEGCANYSGLIWRTLNAGRRMSKPWFRGLFYFLSSPSLSDEDVITMIKSFVEHARYLMKCHTSDNWLLTESTVYFT